MQSRIKNPTANLPGAYEAIMALHKATHEGGVPAVTLELMKLRASQVNGCSVCVDLHARTLRKLGESAERIVCISAWREAPYYSDAERAAIALGEAASRLSDRTDPVPDAIWDEAARHYNESQLSALVLGIGLINLWNCLNASTRQVGGEFLEQYA
jgi:AhpD family alkylhydroperoxidase